MKQHTAIVLLTIVIFITITAFRQLHNTDCNCNVATTEKTIKSKVFNRIPKLDDTLSDEGFYNIPSKENRMLWYRDIESPLKTKFTSLWNDYARNNYHASNLDFIKYYKNKKDIELAFQFGPTNDLWAYHIFVIKKVGCCYLATRSYFRHARFTSKKYAILNKKQLDSLYAVLAEQYVSNLDTIETYDYCGYFVDNRNNKNYFINFTKAQSEEPQKTAMLYDFVDNKINWVKTYSL